MHLIYASNFNFVYMLKHVAQLVLMFADDANHFYEHKDLKTLFSLGNQELQKINEWFEANKPSLKDTLKACDDFRNKQQKCMK